MHDEQQLNAAIARNPDDPGLAAALVDYLIEQNGQERDVVEASVRCRVLTARYTVHQRSVSEMVERDPILCEVIFNELLWMYPSNDLPALGWYAVWGEAPPVVTPMVDQDGRPSQLASYYLVGASWLIPFYRLNRKRLRLLAECLRRERG